MKQKITLLKQKITLLLIAVFTTVLSAQTVNIEGNPHGGNPYATIAAAISDAVDGNVILITGTHTETLSIDKSITLRGTDPTTDIIQASASVAGGTARVIAIYQPSGADKNITIENLSVKNGNSTTQGVKRGGGILVDKNTNGLITLNNLVIEGNEGSEGGGVAALGSNINVTNCTIRNNTATSAGGGMILTAQLTLAMQVNIDKSLIESNTSVNGGGIYINGNNGTTASVSLDIENSTITGNSATSGASGAGGGAIWAKAKNNASNIDIKLVHVTTYNNSHKSAAKNGLSFTGGGTAFTNVEIYNSIIVNADDIAERAINWDKAKPINIVNSIVGGSNAAGTDVDGVNANDFLDDAAKNNEKGKTATNAGLASSLSDEGGNTEVITITASSTADDYCTAATGITLPTIDQRGFDREGVADAGAYELGGVLGLSSNVATDNLISVFPNPATDYVQVKAKGAIDTIKIYSLVGVLKKVATEGDNIDISDLSKGMYVIIIDTEGKQVASKLVID
jgi:hypothetical protein